MTYAIKATGKACIDLNNTGYILAKVWQELGNCIVFWCIAEEWDVLICESMHAVILYKYIPKIIHEF